MIEAVTHRDPVKMLTAISELYDGLPTPRDQRALALLLSAHLQRQLIKDADRSKPASDAMFAILARPRPT